MQAIVTKFIPPTDHRGSRVVARAESGLKLVWDWDHRSDVEENHRAAAIALCRKFGWLGPRHLKSQIATGAIYGGGYAHVFCTRR